MAQQDGVGDWRRVQGLGWQPWQVNVSGWRIDGSFDGWSSATTLIAMISMVKRLFTPVAARKSGSGNGVLLED